MHTRHGIILGFSSQPTSANRDGSIFILHLESDPFTISTAPTWVVNCSVHLQLRLIWSFALV